MSLSAGTRLGPYEVVSAIGAGGMGEVYRARDTKLARDVALKIISDAFALDPDRLARFKREAQVLASLNHPNIAAIHGFEDSSDVHALVLELVEGPTLADRIKQGPIPLDEALPIARQIADALEAAHERGIVHRDLKPANIKVTEDGTVKVLDFGLAKALEGESTSADASMSPTISVAATRMGVILGTAAYMAPEQARGKAVDRRADVWAFGCVLYEMVTGKRAFEGEEVSDTLAAILRGEPDWSIVPARLRRLLRACLEKDRKQRLQSIADYRLLLDERAVATQVSKRPLQWMIATTVTALVALTVGVVHFRETPPVEPVRRFSVAVPDNALVGFLALSPNGRQLVVTIDTGTGSALWRRSLDSTQLQMLAGTNAARAPFWSPDSRSVGFFANGKLRAMPAGGGSAVDLCDAGIGRGGTWSRDGVILFNNDGSGSIDRVEASGGPCTTVIKGDNTTRFSDPNFLPDGRHFFYLALGPDAAKAGLYVASLADVQGHRLLPDQSSGIFAPPRAGGTRGHLLFLRDDKLMAQPFDPEALALEGEPAAVAEGASFSLNPGQVSASFAADGTLVYLSSAPRRFQLTWFDRSGKDAGRVGTPQNERHVAFSPDQKAVASVRTDQGINTVWLHDLARDVETRFASPATAPVWSPDGLHIAFSSRNDLYVQDVDGGRQEALVHNNNAKALSDWSRDGRTLVYTETDPKTRADIWIVSDPLGKGDKKPVLFLRTEFQESQARISPDGRWIAYSSDESGRSEIYVRPFPNGPGKWRISNNQGAEPAWRQDGRELFYSEAAGTRRRIVAVPVTPGPDQRFEAGVPKTLFDFSTVGIVPSANVFIYGPTKDGSRFLADVQTSDSQTTVNVVTNWEQSIADGQPR